MKVLAYRAFSARKLANLTDKKKDFTFATKLENELLDALREAGTPGEIPTPETQEGVPAFADWVKEMEGRF